MFVESPSNPALEIIDLEAVAELTHQAGGLLFVDNVFATPLLQKPLKLGADIVVYSATKHIDGQGRTLGGAILGPAKYIDRPSRRFLRHTGPALSPFNAWMLLKGMETLDLRVERMSRSARHVATFLETQPKIERVLYPGLASHPQHALAARQMRAAARCWPSASRRQGRRVPLPQRAEADPHHEQSRRRKILVTHPATTTHFRLKPEERAALGIDDG